MIRIEQLSKTSRTRRGDDVQALEDIDLSIGENEFDTLVGPSGCGTSSVLTLVTGGTIRRRGKELWGPFPGCPAPDGMSARAGERLRVVELARRPTRREVLRAFSCARELGLNFESLTFEKNTTGLRL